MILLENLRSVFAPPHPAGRPFLIGGVLVAVLGLFISGWLFWPALVFVLFCLYFFRDPERVAPSRPGAVVAPADGHVVSVAQFVPPAELGLGERRAGGWRSSCR